MTSARAEASSLFVFPYYLTILIFLNILGSNLGLVKLLQEHMKFVRTTYPSFKIKYPNYYSNVMPAYHDPGQDYGRAKAGLPQHNQ